MADRDTKLLLARALREVAPRIAAEPRPRPALRVGGIGHREVAADKVQAIHVTLRRIFAMLHDNAETILRKKETSRWFHGPLDCAVITPLAEGADRLIARAGVAEEWQLGSMLPFPQPDYEQTFDLNPDKSPAIADFRALLKQAVLPDGHGVFVLDGKASSEDERLRAYRDCATAIIHRSDFVIAIVERARFESETGSSIREVIALRVPLILIHPETPDRFRVILGGKELPDNDDQAAALANAVRDLFPRTLPHEESDRAAILDFVGEPVRCAIKPGDTDRDETSLLGVSDFEFTGPCTSSTRAPFWIRPFSGLNALGRTILSKVLRRGNGVELPKLPKPDASTLGFDPETAKNFVCLFMHYHRADQTANAYAELQRSAYVLQALLATAVGILTAYDVVYDPSKFLSVVILALLIAIYTIVIVAENEDWQGRWIDYRLLAEVLRAGKALVVAGKGSPLASTRESVIKLNPRHWVSCHATNVFRSLKIAVPGRAVNPDVAALEKAHRYINASYIGGQVRYHTITADYERKLGKALKAASWGIAVLVIFVATANVVQRLFPLTASFGIHSPSGQSLDEPAGHLLKMLVIILPALAAVLVSLRSYNQYEVVSRRSSAMAAALAERLEMDRPFKSFRELGDHVLIAAHMILRDVEGWMDIFITKRMEN